MTIQKNDIINRQYVVQEELGKGGFAQVYKVYDTLLKKDVVLKIMKDVDDDVLSRIRTEIDLSSKVDHPNVVKTIDAGRIYEICSGENSYFDDRYFIKMQYVPSRPLEELIKENKISLKDAKKYSSILADIVKHLELKGILHRDIASKNILIAEIGPILIDFNVSKVLTKDGTGTSGVGSPAYIPPEAVLDKWKLGGDRYSLGVVIYEMVLGALPFNYPFQVADKRTPIDTLSLKPGLNKGLREFLLRSIDFDPNKRFQTIEEMMDEINSIEWEQEKISRGVTLDISRLGYHLSNPNENPILNDLLSIYSQSKYSNSGTRGLDVFADITYVHTLLDDRLTELIESKRYSLIIITGNAGDGKTAFIQRFENEISAKEKNKAVIEQKEGKNGRIILYEGWRYLTNYDGSQDEDDKKNDQVLLDFLRKFEGKVRPEVPKETYIIAINEGRLKDFLFDHRTSFGFLYKQIVGNLDLEQSIDPSMLLVNLNKRQLVFGDELRDPIVDKIIMTMISNDIWTHCEKCDIASKCYVKFNIDSLNNPQFGAQIQERIRALFQIAHLRRKLHITIRDLRSALSYMFFGTSTCQEIHEMVEKGDPWSMIPHLYYNSVFSSTEERSMDRLVQILCEVDPGRTPNPSLESKIYEFSLLENPLFSYFDQRSQVDIDLLNMTKSNYFGYLGTNSEDSASKDLVVPPGRNIVHRSIKRKAFFESIDVDWPRMLPYLRLNEFKDLLLAKAPMDQQKIRNSLLNAIGSTEDPEENNLPKDYLILRNRKDETSSVKSFKMIEFLKFKLGKEKVTDELVTFIEEIPSFLRLSYDQLETTGLDINLDLYELLYRILDGYYPSTNELRGSFVNLTIFKNLLANLVNDRLILQDQKGGRYSVEKSTGNTLLISSL